MTEIKRKVWTIAAVVMIIAAAVFGVWKLDEYMTRKAWERAADNVYEMTNKHIDWTYAGKDGAGR